MPVDALDDDHVDGLFEGIEAEFGEIDLLINVAGRGYVRTLAMMRMSRAFNRRPRGGPAYIVNVAAPAEPDDRLVTYAGSEIAFDRLSQGLSETANPLIRILTLHRLESRAAFANISERVCAELRGLGAMVVPGTQQRAIH